MIHAHIDRESAIPWWAAFGAPLLVVPLLVALMAIWAPRHGVDHAMVGSENGPRTEQIQGQGGSTAELPPDPVARIVRARS
jgi:hypothetical protein